MKILYVEDDECIRQIIEDFFELDDSITSYDLDMAEDGLEGLAKYQENTYDVVFTDINMPNMDGIEMLKEFKKLNKEHCSIYVVTGYSENEMKLKLHKEEIPVLEEVIFKPIIPDKLVDLAKKHKK